MKWAGLLVAWAVIPSAAQPVFEHGHRISNAVTYLTDPPDGYPTGAFSVDASGRLIAGASRVLALLRGGAPGISPAPCVAFETWAEHKSPDYIDSSQSGFTEVERTERKTVLHRFFRDDYSHVYVNYIVTVETLPDSTYRVSFGPSPDAAPAQLIGKVGWKFLSPARFPLPQILQDREAIRIELYSNGTFRRVVDYAHAGRQDRLVMRTDAPHAYYADDAEFAITRPSFRINGVASEVLAPPGMIHGPLLMVYVPGHGRYILTLHPPADAEFQNAGEVAGNALMFASEGNVFQIDTAQRIAAGSGDYAVHVLSDLGWKPPDPRDSAKVLIGAAPFVEPVAEK